MSDNTKSLQEGNVRFRLEGEHLLVMFDDKFTLYLTPQQTKEFAHSLLSFIQPAVMQ